MPSWSSHLHAYYHDMKPFASSTVLVVTLLSATTVTAAAADAPAPTIPELAYAQVSTADIPGFLKIERDLRQKGVQTVLLPLSRLASVDVRDQPSGTTMKKTLVLTFVYEDPVVLTFAEGRTAAEPEAVLAVLRSVAQD